MEKNTGMETTWVKEPVAPPPKMEAGRVPATFREPHGRPHRDDRHLKIYERNQIDLSRLRCKKDQFYVVK